MRTVYEVHDKGGALASGPWADPNGASDMAAWCDITRCADVPHAVVERQVAGPEDTDELLRLRALVDDLWIEANDHFRMDAYDVIAMVRRHGFGGES